jgi:hypothetical protein
MIYDIDGTKEKEGEGGKGGKMSERAFCVLLLFSYSGRVNPK